MTTRLSVAVSVSSDAPSLPQLRTPASHPRIPDIGQNSLCRILRAHRQTLPIEVLISRDRSVDGQDSYIEVKDCMTLYDSS